MSEPVKRGPGRPRKQPVPVESTEATPDAVAEETAQAEADGDPRIGAECDPAWSSVGYDDGSTYRCEHGKIVERVL